MIRIENYFDQVPERLKVQQKQEEKQLLEEKKIEKGCWKNVKKELLAYFHNKCAYCETPLVSPESIDHYRPKAQDKYYWLAHEWTNFLPCCQKCQDAKKDDFVAENPHLEVPLLEDGSLDYEKCKANGNYLLSENPLFLHPVLDNPSEHLSLEIGNFDKLGKKQGRIIAKTKKGEVSRQFYNLDRPNLVLERIKIIREFLDILIAEKQFLKKNNIPDELIDQAALELLIPTVEENLKNQKKEYIFVWKEISLFFGIFP